MCFGAEVKVRRERVLEKLYRQIPARSRVMAPSAARIWPCELWSRYRGFGRISIKMAASMKPARGDEVFQEALASGER
jgi:hypothetical protein